MSDCFEKATDKQYINVDILKLLDRMITKIPNKSLSISDQIAFELEIVGYISTTYAVDKRLCIVTDVDAKYSPKISLHSLGNGKEVVCKVNKTTFKDTPLKVGQIVRCDGFNEKSKMRKTEKGWEITDTKEWWLTNYKIVENMEV